MEQLSGMPPPDVKQEHTRLVPAVERAVRLVDALAAAGRPLSLSELVRTLDLPKSSVHGLLATLDALGLARRDAGGEYSLGMRPLRWADAWAGGSGLLQAFERHASGLAELQAETVMLAVLEGADVTYLACRQGSRPLAVNFRVGGRFPAACTSSGKAMLATCAPEDVRGLLPANLPRLTQHGPTTHAALARQLAGIRAQGYAVDDEETAQGMQCFGAAVFAGREPRACAAVAASLIKAGLTSARREAVTVAIRELARRMSQDLGAPRDGL